FFRGILLPETSSVIGILANFDILLNFQLLYKLSSFPPYKNVNYLSFIRFFEHFY
ncbi:conserved hypothetical protein, partial [Listeria monocytogenes FSL F2-208]